jgi:hypothetical protein
MVMVNFGIKFYLKKYLNFKFITNQSDKDEL